MPKPFVSPKKEWPLNWVNVGVPHFKNPPISVTFSSKDLSPGCSFLRWSVGIWDSLDVHKMAFYEIKPALNLMVHHEFRHIYDVFFPIFPPWKLPFHLEPPILRGRRVAPFLSASTAPMLLMVPPLRRHIIWATRPIWGFPSMGRSRNGWFLSGKIPSRNGCFGCRKPSIIDDIRENPIYKWMTDITSYDLRHLHRQWFRQLVS